MKRQTERFGGDDLAKRANKMAVGREFAAGVGSLKVCNDFVETLDDRGELYTRIQSCTSLAKEALEVVGAKRSYGALTMAISSPL